MTEAENLVLEILKWLRAEFVLMREDMSGIRSVMASMKHHMAAFLSHGLAQDSDIASLKIRVERIGRRLDPIG